MSASTRRYMGFDPSSLGAGWLAAAAGGFSVGAAVAWAARALSARRKGAFRRSRRCVSLVFVGLSAAVAAGTILLIMPPKSLLADAGLWLWTGAWAPAGLLCVFFPRWAGAPLAVIVLAALGVLASEASAWHPMVPGREVARFVPYETGEGKADGDLAVPDRNAVPILSRLALDASSCALEARVLEFSGPFEALFGKRRYALSRVVDGQGRELHRFPGKRGPLGSVIKDRDVRLPGISVFSVQSDVRPLEELGPVSWAFDGSGRLGEPGPEE